MSMPAHAETNTIVFQPMAFGVHAYLVGFGPKFTL